MQSIDPWTPQDRVRSLNRTDCTWERAPKAVPEANMISVPENTGRPTPIMRRTATHPKQAPDHCEFRTSSGITSHSPNHPTAHRPCRWRTTPQESNGPEFPGRPPERGRDGITGLAAGSSDLGCRSCRYPGGTTAVPRRNTPRCRGRCVQTCFPRVRLSR